MSGGTPSSVIRDDFADQNSWLVLSVRRSHSAKRRLPPKTSMPTLGVIRVFMGWNSRRQVRAGTGFFAAALATVRSVAAAGDLEAADRVESHLTDASPVVGEPALLLGADRAAVPVASDFAPVRAGVGPTAVESRSIAAPVPLPVRIDAGSRSVAVVSDFGLADAGVARSVAVVEAVQDSAGNWKPRC